MSHTEYSAQFVQYSSVFLGLEEAPMERVDPDSPDPLAKPASSTQYGAVPPKGAIIQMVRYHTGGGRRGNVQKGAIRYPKTAVPYVASVINLRQLFPAQVN